MAPRQGATWLLRIHHQFNHFLCKRAVDAPDRADIVHELDAQLADQMEGRTCGPCFKVHRRSDNFLVYIFAAASFAGALSGSMRGLALLSSPVVVSNTACSAHPRLINTSLLESKEHRICADMRRAFSSAHASLW